MIVIGWRKGRGRGQGLESCLSIGLLHFGVCAVVFFEGKMTAGNVLDMGEKLALGVGNNLEVKTGLLCCVTLWSMGSGCFEKSWKFC